jgi:hypothetical protein
MARDDPSGFVRVVANILPDKLEVAVTHEIKRIERVIVDRVIEHDATPALSQPQEPEQLPSVALVLAKLDR